MNSLDFCYVISHSNRSPTNIFHQCFDIWTILEKLNYLKIWQSNKTDTLLVLIFARTNFRAISRRGPKMREI